MRDAGERVRAGSGLRRNGEAGRFRNVKAPLFITRTFRNAHWLFGNFPIATQRGLFTGGVPERRRWCKYVGYGDPQRWTSPQRT